MILITGFPGKKKRAKHQHIVSMFGPIMVRVVGVEPTRITSQEPKSCASANSAIPAFPRITPDKTETFAGKWTARVTKIFNHPDGSIIKATRKINKDGSITDKIEHRHK